MLSEITACVLLQGELCNAVVCFLQRLLLCASVTHAAVCASVCYVAVCASVTHAAVCISSACRNCCVGKTKILLRAFSAQ